MGPYNSATDINVCREAAVKLIAATTASWDNKLDNGQCDLAISHIVRYMQDVGGADKVNNYLITVILRTIQSGKGQDFIKEMASTTGNA